MDVKVYPYIQGTGYGNIMWPTKHVAMRAGKFPPRHPIGGGFCDNPDGQSGTSPEIAKFRERGYWASCFPEGDGITWKPINGQDHDQCMADIRECFRWNATWGRKP